MRINRYVLTFYYIWCRGSHRRRHRRPKAWTHVSNISVEGKGRGQKSIIPIGSFDAVGINGGSTQAFFVNVISNSRDMATLKYGSTYDVYTENAEVSVLVGKKKRVTMTFSIMFALMRFFIEL